MIGPGKTTWAERVNRREKACASWNPGGGDPLKFAAGSALVALGFVLVAVVAAPTIQPQVVMGM